MILKNCVYFPNQYNNCVVTDSDRQKQDLAEWGNKWVSYSMIAQGLKLDLPGIDDSPLEASWLIQLSKSVLLKGTQTGKDFSMTGNW